ncbi:MAG TPA: hypothetical protein VI168_17880 [Croceibacterium sp.]
MREAIIVGWVILVALLALNGTAAGLVALLHSRSADAGRGNRISLAALAAGAMPASFMIVVPLAEGGSGEQPIVWLLAAGAVLAVGTAVSLPGAILVSRKLGKPGEDYRAFE